MRHTVALAIGVSLMLLFVYGLVAADYGSRHAQPWNTGPHEAVPFEDALNYAPAHSASPTITAFDDDIFTIYEVDPVTGDMWVSWSGTTWAGSPSKE